MSATVPTQYPTPLPTAARATQGRPLRGPMTAFMRQPDLGSPPAVSAVTGFGGGSGATIVANGSDADQSQGLVAIRVGAGAAAGGTIVLKFPLAPPAAGYVWLAEWASITAAFAGNVATLTWTATRPLIAGERLLVAYQWSQSQ